MRSKNIVGLCSPTDSSSTFMLRAASDCAGVLHGAAPSFSLLHVHASIRKLPVRRAICLAWWLTTQSFATTRSFATRGRS